MSTPHLLQPGQIISNLIPGEPVVLTQVQPRGQRIALHYTGKHTGLASTVVITQQQAQELTVLAEEGLFSFDGDPVGFSLFAEAERIYSAYQFDPLFAVNCSVVDPLPHQVEAVYKYLLPLPNIRFLLADDTGAGKTIMTGLLIKELMTRNLVERVLIITPGGLTRQWQEDEMGLKFNIPFKLVNRAAFSADPTIFQNTNRVVTSIDFLRGEDVLNAVRSLRWDLVVVDEAHKLSAFDYGERKYRSKRYEAVQALAQSCEHLLLLTATPHRGRRDTFRNLLQLLDEDIFSTDTLVTERVRELGENGINKFFIRRLKEDMRDWQGQPLFKERFTKTILYRLTPAEKKLYDDVTAYLSRHREEARQEQNIHVTLALLVMQRRLTSSIYAIKRTLWHRHQALQGLLDELTNNPGLWGQRQRLDPTIASVGLDSIDEYDELDDREREGLETILADPRKFKLFTTAKSPAEIREEARQVKALFEQAEALYGAEQEEQKFAKLRELLGAEGVRDNHEKLVIFTEHKDTLDYLDKRLTNNGYTVVTIHGGKSVDERRTAQLAFAGTAQILIATDAAGEGINLQFCRLLINWDIPWNPNRLEQRMGRIHRYGQQQNVMVFNLVAQNTREGAVMERLLLKLDEIRNQMGDDRVYDVISDVFENVGLDDIINAVFNGQDTLFNDAIQQQLNPSVIRQRIDDQRNQLAFSGVNYREARQLKEESDEKRLQPVYIRQFFEKAFTYMGGKLQELQPQLFRITTMPDELTHLLRTEYDWLINPAELYLCFDKRLFLERQRQVTNLTKTIYLNPGNALFDALLSLIQQQCRPDALKGVVLVSPEDRQPYTAFLVQSQVTFHRGGIKRQGSTAQVADERLVLVCENDEGELLVTSAAKLLDLLPPALFTKPIEPPDSVATDTVIDWSFTHITEPLLAETEARVQQDAWQRRQYLETAFTDLIIQLTAEISELQGKWLLGDAKAQDKIARKQERINQLLARKKQRLADLDAMEQLNLKEPEVLGCARVVPLTQLEFTGHFGMSRDDEAEQIAMDTVMAYESAQGRIPTDVSAENVGYDIRSAEPDGIKRYIEVKGRSVDGDVMLTDNEMCRLEQLGTSAWLYIVTRCKTEPQLFTFQNPAATLRFDKLSRGVQYRLPEAEWKQKQQADALISV
ncbi:SNF2 domain-containing protein [Spirosoma oryzae]|uniref:SNF2 domain-containing protein n=1 Tax=Spirosoma oryzae TaxID=1469603 RepID=A0A2T0RMD4_9BACT|nr:helicase-related protein [Spirosoma oryzae]PRY22290.1 SNF2 domain-containing protein [Spirosoma oryzae]